MRIKYSRSSKSHRANAIITVYYRHLELYIHYTPSIENEYYTCNGQLVTPNWSKLIGKANVKTKTLK